MSARNAARAGRLAEERAVHWELPIRALVAYREEDVTVKRWGSSGYRARCTRCPSRLIGHRACVRVHANHLEVRCRGALVAWPEPVRGEGLQGIDYRHVVHSLIRKPAAFRRQVCRETVFLSTVFRRAYDAVRGGGGAGLDARGRRGPGVRRRQGAYLGVAAAGRVRRCRR